jgi:DNA adenine methylase
MFPYIGGKAHHVRWLQEFFPKHNTFVEVFGGAGWVSVKSDRLADTCIYNDYNSYLANLYYCIVNKPTELLNIMNSIVGSDSVTFKQYQRELFVDCVPVVLGDVELAHKYIYIQTQVFSGTALSATCVPYFVDIKSAGKYSSKYETFKKKLANETYRKNLNNITVENVDCCDLIKKYDSPDTFFYVDPPYYNMEFYYSKDFPREKHEELANTLKAITGKFALSYYDFDDLKIFYPEYQYRWHKQDVYRSASTRGALKHDHNNRGQEILIMNYLTK